MVGFLTTNDVVAVINNAYLLANDWRYALLKDDKLLETGCARGTKYIYDMLQDLHHIAL